MALLLTSLLGILMAAAAATLFAAFSFGLALRGEAGLEFPVWSLTGFSALAALLTIPAYLAARAFFGSKALNRSERSRPSSLWLIAVSSYPLFLMAGALASTPGWPSALLAAIALLGTSLLPVAAIVWLVRRLGPATTSLRAWGHFTVGLTWMPGAALGAEMVALLPPLLALGFWLTTTAEGSTLMRMMQDLSPADPQAVENLLRPILGSPAALLAVYGYVGLAVPAIEEAAKTMAVWPFLRRRITGAEAFLGGALGGAGYALFEALFLTQPGDAWLVTTIARSGASLLHIFTAGLTSWGLVSAVRSRRWFLLIGTYATSVGLHAAWNVAALTQGLASVPIETAAPTVAGGSTALTLAWMTGLSLMSFLGLVLVWGRLGEARPEEMTVEADAKIGPRTAGPG